MSDASPMPTRRASRGASCKPTGCPTCLAHPLRCGLPAAFVGGSPGVCLGGLPAERPPSSVGVRAGRRAATALEGSMCGRLTRAGWRRFSGLARRSGLSSWGLGRRSGAYARGARMGAARGRRGSRKAEVEAGPGRRWDVRLKLRWHSCALACLVATCAGACMFRVRVPLPRHLPSHASDFRDGHMCVESLVREHSQVLPRRQHGCVRVAFWLEWPALSSGLAHHSLLVGGASERRKQPRLCFLLLCGPPLLGRFRARLGANCGCPHSPGLCCIMPSCLSMVCVFAVAS